MSILENIHSHADLCALPAERLDALCAEIRAFLINSLSRTGGHLASNLGTVELSVALDSVYDPWRDRIVFDVGHQCYTHKLLTGRMAGFDRLRCRNLESVGYLKDRGISMPMILDHNVYDFNSFTEEILEELTGIADFELTLPLELSRRELSELQGSSRHKRELVVYGRAPMMVSAQCVHAAESGCDRKPGLKLITDRTGRHLPVRNYCSFCYNVIYNFAPTVLWDLENELSAIDHQSRRYEFTVEKREETLKILRNDIKYKENEFTRGWFRRGAE